MNEVQTPALGLFQGFGVELEYMIVDAASLSVLPLSDQVLKTVAGDWTSEVELNGMAWCNELVLHVLEIKTNGPASTLSGLEDDFQVQVRKVNAILEPHGARLLPTAMHPWMDPDRETRLWPHENSPVYDAYNRIFDCRGHGWANLQSTHMNLPFSGDDQFGRLHAAIRLLLPIMPALAASSPLVDGRLSGVMDTRLHVYRSNQKRVPFITGSVVPEGVFSRADYDEQILGRIYEDIRPHDAEGILQHEWLNSRGAIARFERSTIEIRVLDVQECPRADLAIYRIIVEVLRALVEERWSSFAEQQSQSTEHLAALFQECVSAADRALIEGEDYLRALGFSGQQSLRSGEIWQRLAERINDLPELDSGRQQALRIILNQGPLSRRLLSALGHQPPHSRIHEVYAQLAECLASGEMFSK